MKTGTASEAAFDPANDAAPGTAPVQPQPDDSETLPSGIGEPKTDSRGFPRKSSRVDGWKGRNGFLRLCVSMGLSGPAIAKLSLSTPQPMRTHQQVYDKIEEQNLVTLFNSAVVRRRRFGDHNKGLTDIFQKTFGQAMEFGYEVTEVFRDESPAPGSRFRADIGMRIGSRQFYWEYQTSKLEYTRWHDKLKNYVRLYETVSKPFRAVFVVQDDYSVTKVRAYARDLLTRKHPNLDLFYFITKPAFDRQWDVIRTPCYRGAWDAKELFTLM